MAKKKKNKQIELDSNRINKTQRVKLFLSQKTEKLKTYFKTVTFKQYLKDYFKLIIGLFTIFAGFFALFKIIIPISGIYFTFLKNKLIENFTKLGFQTEWILYLIIFIMFLFIYFSIRFIFNHYSEMNTLDGFFNILKRTDYHALSFFKKIFNLRFSFILWIFLTISIFFIGLDLVSSTYGANFNEKNKMEISLTINFPNETYSSYLSATSHSLDCWSKTKNDHLVQNDLASCDINISINHKNEIDLSFYYLTIIDKSNNSDKEIIRNSVIYTDSPKNFEFTLNEEKYAKYYFYIALQTIEEKSMPINSLVGHIEGKQITQEEHDKKRSEKWTFLLAIITLLSLSLGQGIKAARDLYKGK